MFDKMFKEHGTDPISQEIIKNFVDDAILDVNNDLKLKKIDIDDRLVGAVLLMVINNKVGIEFLRILNLCLNGADETAYANVTDFLNKIEAIYIRAENDREDLKNKGEI